MRPKFLDPKDITKKVLITGLVLAGSWAFGALAMAGMGLGAWAYQRRKNRG